MGRAPAVYKAPGRDLCSARVSVVRSAGWLASATFHVLFFFSLREEERQERITTAYAAGTPIPSERSRSSSSSERVCFEILVLRKSHPFWLLVSFLTTNRAVRAKAREKRKLMISRMCWGWHGS